MIVKNIGQIQGVEWVQDIWESKRGLWFSDRPFHPEYIFLHLLKRFWPVIKDHFVESDHTW